MLSQEDNEILTRVGPGTLMGNLLEPGESWQVLGTWDDPTVQESMAVLQAD
jgi:hypothetical protein